MNEPSNAVIAIALAVFIIGCVISMIGIIMCYKQASKLKLTERLDFWMLFIVSWSFFVIGPWLLYLFLPPLADTLATFDKKQH